MKQAVTKSTARADEATCFGLPKNCLVQLRIGLQPLEPGSLPLQFLELLGMNQLQSTVLLPPALVRRVRHSALHTCLGHRP